MDSNLNILKDEQLVKMAQEGSQMAEELLLEKYKTLAKNKAKNYYIEGADGEDVVQEGMIGLFKAIKFYDQDRCSSFKTFATTCVNNQIMSAIKKANRNKHQPLNKSLSLEKSTDDELDACLGDTFKAPFDSEPENIIIMNEVAKGLTGQDAGMFSQLELEILREKLKGKEIGEIAKALGKSRRSVTNGLQRIKKKVVAYIGE